MLTNIRQQAENGRLLGTRPLPFFHDGMLPNLWQLADPQGMGQRFQSHFRLRYPDHRFTVTGCTIEKLYYRPEKSCKALYRLHFYNQAGQTDEQWFSAQMYPVSKSLAKFERAKAKAKTADSFWEPIGFWPELDTVFWAFPHDPQLPQLTKLTQPQTLSQLFAASTPLTYKRLKMMPRKRCLLHISGERDADQFVTKSYAAPRKGQSKGRYAHQLFGDVYQATQQNRLLTVPRPLFYNQTLDTYAQVASPGHALPTMPTIQTMQLAAQALAQFHQLANLPHLQPSQRTADLVTQVQRDNQLLGNFLPYERRLPTLATQLMLAALVLSGEPPVATPIHGAFRLSQLLAENGRFVLLDLDDAGWGDPHLDVAECMASLLNKHFTDNARLSELQANAATFSQAYAQATPWPLDMARLHGYIALSLFQKLAGAFRRLETAVFPKIDRMLNLIEHHLEHAYF